MRKVLLNGCLILSSVLLKAENSKDPGIVVKTHVYNDGVAIRWTPVSLHLWRKWSAEGYRLERFTIAKNGTALNEVESVLAGGKNIMPFTASQWNEYTATRPEANLIRHCLMAKDRTELKDKGTYLSAMKEENECYVFSMLAMQNSFELAIAGGIGFIDNSIKNDEIYLYKLYPINSGEKDTIRFVVNMEEVTVLPLIENFRISYENNNIMIRWPAQKYLSAYFGYRIEKSLDSGKTYFPLNEVPFVPSHFEGKSERVDEIYSDTVSHLYQSIHYRIRGLDYFGQYGMPSLSDSIIVFPETKAFPEFLEIEKDDGKTCVIQWQFNKENEKLIRGFSLMTCDSSDGEYIMRDTQLIEVEKRSFELKTTQMITYFKIAAVTLNSSINSSFSLMVQRVDSFPPKAPELLYLSVDTAGVVKLNWKTNREKDFKAYMVFRGNSRFQEFSAITSSYCKDTFIQDTLTANLLRDSVYYKVLAIDERYNESAYSEILAAIIPEKIPPAPPVIYDASADYKSAIIKWHKSNSNDVFSYHLVRHSSMKNESKIIKIDKEMESYKDTSVNSGETYQYALYAVDLTGLKSKMAKPYEIKIPLERILPQVFIKAVFNDTAKKYISIFWDYKFDSEVHHYRILQVNPDGSSQTIGNAYAGNTFYNYYYLQPYTMTTYYIVAYFKDGRRSKI